MAIYKFHHYIFQGIAFQLPMRNSNPSPSSCGLPTQVFHPQTRLGRLLRMENLTSAQAAKAILSVFPLDSFVTDHAGRMEMASDPATILPVQAEVQVEIDAAEGKSWPMVSIERFDFYDRAKTAYAVIQTGERRFYGCFIFRKGVIAPGE